MIFLGEKNFVKLDYETLKIPSVVVERIKLLSNVEKFEYATFYKNVKKNFWCLRLSNDYTPHCFKVVYSKHGYIVIKYSPIYRSFFKKGGVVYRKVFITGVDGDVIISNKVYDEGETLKLIPNYKFGNKIANKLRREMLKSKKCDVSIVSFEKSFEKTFGFFRELLESKSSVYERDNGEVSFVIISVVNDLLLLRKFNGKVFRSGSNLSMKAIILLNGLLNGNITIRKKLPKTF